MRSRFVPSVVLALGVGLAVFSGTLFVGAVVAQEAIGSDEVARRLQWLHELPPEQKAKLKAALERFHGLTSAERDKLRSKAAKVGAERLDGLAGRDIEKLRHSKVSLDAEVDQIVRGFDAARVATLTDDERAWLRAEALRGFQRHLERRLLGLSSYEEVQKLAPAERKAMKETALRRVLSERINALPDEEQARLRALDADGKRAANARLLADFRMDETRSFATMFERWRFQPFVNATPEERAKQVRKWREGSRWHEVVRFLKQEIGIDEEARHDLAVLGPADLARVRFEFEQTESLPIAERRLRLERLIHQIVGERTLDGRRPDRQIPPFLRLLRERRTIAVGSDPATPR
ncbi:MAG: hypothetical protein K8T90_00860 [Planctomycetes bacterium]|nr:hypothetical protein [Planctomycetota bacterium]